MTYLFSNTSSIFQSNGTAISNDNPLAVTVGGANITIQGNTNIISNVEVTNFPNVQTVNGNVNATLIGSVTVSGITSNVNVNPITGNVGVIGNVNVNPITGNVIVTAIGNLDLTGNTLPVTGNVNATITNNLTISSINSNVTVVDGGGSITVDGNVGITGTTNVSITGGSVEVSGFRDGLKDAFGRLRVSNPLTLFDTQARYYDHEQFSSSITGATANVVYNANSSTFLCSVGTASGDQVLRETVRTFTYQPGKSLLIYQSFCMNASKANLRQRVGYFGAQNGIYFEVDGSNLYMVIRSYSSGAIVEDRVAQADWNINSLSNSIGTNPSGITLNPALIQIWFCDIEWLGSGTVRVGFIIDGNYVECHHFHHANIPSTAYVNNTTTYMTTATLPLRLEITNTGITASPSTLRQICASVISEGGYQLLGNPRAASHLIGTPRRLPNDASFVPVIAIRLKSTMLDAVVVPINYSLVPAAQSLFQFRVYKYAITSGGSWVDSAADSAVQYNLAPTALVSGNIVEQSFFNSTNQSAAAPTQEQFSFVYQLEREPFTGTPYEYVITMATTGTNQDIYASIEWQEMT